MSAIERKIGPAAATLLLCIPISAWAQNEAGGDKRTKIEYNLTQQSAPGATPWEQPALLSYTFDRDGPDYYNVELNGDLDVSIYKSPDGTGAIHEMSIGPSISYVGSSDASDRKDNLAAGLTTKYHYQSADGNFGLHAVAALDYAREAVFPDRSKAPCDADETSLFCQKQHSESLKASLDLYPFLGGFEGSAKSHPGGERHNRSLSWSFSPRIQIAHDAILNGPIDATTGVSVTGRNTSLLAGAGLELTPGFIDPRFKINLTGTIRQGLSRSPGRTDLTDRTEGRMQLSATYFVTPQDVKTGWRAGVSVIWTEGGDSFADQAKESTIVLAFRIGHF